MEDVSVGGVAIQRSSHPLGNVPQVKHRPLLCASPMGAFSEHPVRIASIQFFMCLRSKRMPVAVVPETYSSSLSGSWIL